MRKARSNKANSSVTMNEVIMAKRNQFQKLRNHALRNEQYFLAEYYENMSKAIR